MMYLLNFSYRPPDWAERAANAMLQQKVMRMEESGPSRMTGSYFFLKLRSPLLKNQQRIVPVKYLGRSFPFPSLCR